MKKPTIQCACRVYVYEFTGSGGVSTGNRDTKERLG